MVITTVKSNGTVAREIREILSEHYDLIIKSRYTADGKDIHIELDLYPKGSLPVEKPKKKMN